MDSISYEDFRKLEVKIGTVLSVEKVPETDKLLKFEIDLGEDERTIVGGWAVAYPDPSVLVGKQVPVLVNLEPRTIRGVESQGMILSATKGDQPVALFPDQEVNSGAEVR